MMHDLSVNQASSLRWTFCQDVVRYSALGFTSIGLLRPKLDEMDLDDAAELLYEMKMSVTSLSWVGGFTEGGVFSYPRAIEDAQDALRAAALLQSPCVLLNPGGQNGHTRKNARRVLLQALRELVPVAEDLHVRLVIEPTPIHDGLDRNMLDGWEEVMEHIAPYPSRWLGLALDLFHIGHDEKLLSQLPTLLDRVALVQLADRAQDCRRRCRRLPLGRGSNPIERWLKSLRDLKYTGPIELELYGEELRGADYHTSIQQAQDYLARLGFVTPVGSGTVSGE